MIFDVGGPYETFSEHQLHRRRPQESAPHLELLLECERPLSGPARYRLSGVRRVRLGRGPERSARLDDDGVVDVAVPDGWMSSRHAELLRVGDVWELTDLGSKNGTLKNGARVRGTDGVPVGDGDLLQLGHTFFRFREELPVSGPAFVDARDLPEQAGSLSPAFAVVIERARAVAPTRVPVLLRGESGTGAFSSAHADHLGLIRTSDGGTLFLDEIGDLPLDAQPALLRVIQDHEVMPVGVARRIPVDLRVIAATHRDIEDLVREGRFRNDLFARLDGVALDLPPLRDRREDVPLLIASLLHKLAPERRDVKLSPDAVQALLEHDWPRNVRELEQALAGALALSTTGAIERAHLPRAVREAAEDKAQPRELTAEEQRHRQELILLLAQHRGNLAAVARAIGKGRTQVVRWMERYALDAESFRTG
jgi:sigma-54 dependent transcriptional regulator, acetoin dehydrogenase operon transcriptional activator AcoR